MVKIPFIDYKSTEYGLISGPLFTVVYTICGVLISYFGSAKVRHGRVQRQCLSRARNSVP